MERKKITRLEALMKETRDLPPGLLAEVLDYARFLRLRWLGREMESAVLSEPILSEDWLTSEEDEAWKDL